MTCPLGVAPLQQQKLLGPLTEPRPMLRLRPGRVFQDRQKPEKGWPPVEHFAQ
ncbi:hypothetical protein [Mumia zhuanghuii]|uniref:hypothetical protein n=1 Tax=Mumia zhuanghuii TaxID=2585211 RepID=UPI00129C1837|nr:hypothetical protein [Mumia zhuanghuii]